MPDTNQQSKDDTASEAKEKESPPPVSKLSRKRPRWQYMIIGAVAFFALVFGSIEVHDRLAYVHEVDARIQTDLITVSSRVSGWVANIGVSQGDKIAKGSILVKIDDRESRIRIEELEAQLQGTLAERKRLEADRHLVDKQTSSRLKSERAQLETAKVAVSSLKPQLELADRELKRSQKLFARKVISRRQLDLAETAHQRLDREYSLAIAARNTAEAKLQEAQAERAKLDVLTAELNVMLQKEGEYRAKIANQKLDLNDRTIKSSIDGVVDRVFVDAGEYITPGQRLALIHDPKKIWIEANIKETEIRKLEIGHEVEITIDAYPDKKFKGRVKSIGDSTTSEFALLPTPNPSGNFTKITQRLPVRIAIDQEGRQLRPGMMVVIKIDIDSPAEAAQAAKPN
ncbi:MAG: HlyD family secretion protein [Rhodospirillales bacterium]